MKMYCIVFNKHGKLEALDSLQVRESDHIIMEVSKDIWDGFCICFGPLRFHMDEDCLRNAYHDYERRWWEPLHK